MGVDDGVGRPSCGVEVGDPVRAKLRKVNATLRQNYMMLGIAVVLTVVAIVGVLYLVTHMMEAVRMYYRYIHGDGGGPSDEERRKDNDDERYGSTVVTVDGNRIVEDETEDRPSEYAAIRSKIDSIKKKYKPYNREMSQYARNVLHREPDDLMDERILNRDSDDYDYGNKRDKNDD